MGHEFPTERLPTIPREAMSAEQATFADALIKGPRGAVIGPFIALLYAPHLAGPVAALGEGLRFKGTLADPVRELVICVVAAFAANEFEWQTHVPLARKAGVASSTLEQVAARKPPDGLPPDLQCACDFASELMRRHAVGDAVYAGAHTAFGESGVVELAVLVGYFVMVSGLINTAGTPGPADPAVPALSRRTF